MLLGGAKDEHFSCFLSSCQLGLRDHLIKSSSVSKEEKMLWYGTLVKSSGAAFCCRLVSVQCTEVRFASFLSGGFITAIHSSKSTGKETGKTHLCALVGSFCRLHFFWLRNLPFRYFVNKVVWSFQLVVRQLPYSYQIKVRRLVSRGKRFP